MSSELAMREVAKRLSRNLYILMGTPRKDTKKIWKNKDLSEKSGVSVSIISNIKNDYQGNKKPTMETVVKLAQALDVDPVELLK